MPPPPTAGRQHKSSPSICGWAPSPSSI